MQRPLICAKDLFAGFLCQCGWFQHTLVLASPHQFSLLIILISQTNFWKVPCYPLIYVIDKDRKQRSSTICLHKPLLVAILFPTFNQFSTQLAFTLWCIFIYILLIWFSHACNSLKVYDSRCSVKNIIFIGISKKHE